MIRLHNKTPRFASKIGRVFSLYKICGLHQKGGVASASYVLCVRVVAAQRAAKKSPVPSGYCAIT